MAWALCIQSLVKQLGTCTMALWQHYQDGHQRERREGRRQEQPLKPAPGTAPPSGPASHLLAGCRPCMVAPPPGQGGCPLRCSCPQGASPSSHSGPTSGAQEGPSTSHLRGFVLAAAFA